MSKKAIIAGKDWDDSYRPEQILTRDFLAKEYPTWDIKTEYIVSKLTLDGKPYRSCKPDIAIPKERIIIRLNGMYHYTSERQQLKDEFQKTALEQAGWRVIDFDCRKMENLFKLKTSRTERTYKLAIEEIEKRLGKVSYM